MSRHYALRKPRNWLASVWMVLVTGCGAPATQLRVIDDPAEAPLTQEEIDNEYRSLAHAAYAQGAYLRETGELGAALERFTRAVRLYPRDAGLRMAVAQTQLQMGQSSEAAEFLRQAISRFGGSIDELILMARLNLVSGRDKQAVANLQSALAIDSTHVQSMELLSRHYLETGQFEAALPLLLRLAALLPAEAEVWMQLGDTHRALGQAEEAIAAYEKALQIDQEQLVAMLQIAKIHAEQGRDEQAEQQFRVALDSAPGDPTLIGAFLDYYVKRNDLDGAEQLLRPYYEAEELNPQQSYVFGRILAGLGRYDEAEEVLIPLSELEGVRGISPILGEIAFRQEDLVAARRHFTKAIEEDPLDCNAYASLVVLLSSELRSLSRVEVAQSSAADSMRVLLRAASRATGSDELRCNLLLGMGYSQLRDYESAVDHLEASRKLDPDNTSIMFNLAMAHQELGHFETALQLGRDLLEIEPTNAAALNFVGYILAERGLELEQSASMIQKALEQEPENGYYVDSLGWAFYQMGDFDRAATELERAVALTEEKDPIILEHLGDAYREIGDLNGAYRVYLQSRDLDSENPGLHEKIREVESELGRP